MANDPSLEQTPIVVYQTEAEKKLALRWTDFIPYQLSNKVPQHQFYLLQTIQGLQLRDQQQPKLFVQTEFIEGRMGYRRRHDTIKNFLLARACQLKATKPIRILDATAGLGRDGFMLAWLGAQVILCERNPYINLLLADGLSRTQAALPKHPVWQRLQHCPMDANKAFQELEQPDTIVLDPMFEHPYQRGEVKKDMQMLKKVVGQPDDLASLLNSALKFAKKSVIVKRPIHAPTITRPTINHSLIGKKNRYDVYLP